MSIAYTGNASSGSSASQPLSVWINGVTAGNTLVVTAACHGASAGVLFGLSDSGGNWWRYAVASFDAGNNATGIYYTTVTTGGNLLVTLSCNQNIALGIDVREFSGIDQGTPLNSVTAAYNQTGDIVYSGSGTASVNNCLAIASYESWTTPYFWQFIDSPPWGVFNNQQSNVYAASQYLITSGTPTVNPRVQSGGPPLFASGCLAFFNPFLQRTQYSGITFIVSGIMQEAAYATHNLSSSPGVKFGVNPTFLRTSARTASPGVQFGASISYLKYPGYARTASPGVQFGVAPSYVLNLAGYIYPFAYPGVKFGVVAIANGGRSASLRELQYIGRYQIGDRVPLHQQCVTANTYVIPDHPVLVRVYRLDGAAATHIASAMIPVDGTSPAVVGKFLGEYQLGSSDKTERYLVVYYSAHSGNAIVGSHVFEVLPGGDIAGAIISLASVERPAGNLVMAQSQAGQLFQGIGPSIVEGV